ncbi:MAG: nitrogen fixation protein NifQ [Defluviicoccus sp.]|nr:nitrogen fixation protein NifQ [Defluviicoccus sp.]MDG4591184.1 nitrogen fixation protein NifQ [Defluviicoccus sp.]
MADSGADGFCPASRTELASPGDLYDRLLEGGSGDPFDRHVFVCALVIAMTEAWRPLPEALGLAAPELGALMARYLPHAVLPVAVPAEAGAGEDALEEPDLRRLLLDHRSDADDPAGRWLAAIIARRSCRPNHLWQDLGLFNRGELSRLMLRHFQPLAARNRGDMKWKKFFYRTLCAEDGIVVCKAPNCETCSDVDICFGGEPGEPLALFQSPLLQSRQK